MNIAVRAEPAAADADELREAMRHLARGVSVVTAGIGAERTGLTATTAFSLSIDPPTMIVCVNRSASALPVIAANRHFCVSLLASHQQDIADRFAGRGGVAGSARYEGGSWTRHATGASALVDGVASIDCALEEIIERHSHAILIGGVRAVQVNGGEPLIYSDGGFGTFAALDSRNPSS